MGRKKKPPVNPLQGERLNEVMRENNLTQTQLGKIVGCEQQAISKYITLDVQIPADVAEIIGRKYNVRPSWLLCWDNWKTFDAEYAEYESYMVSKTWDSMEQSEELLRSLGISFQFGEVKQIPRWFISEDTGERREFMDDDRDDPNAYSIIKDNCEVGRCSINERSKLIDAITDYAENEAKKLIELSQKRGVDNG